MAIKLVALVLAGALTLAPTQVTAETYYPQPPHRIEVNTCGGGVLTYDGNEALGVTATHCIAFGPIWVTMNGDPGMVLGQKLRSVGDITFFRFQPPIDPHVFKVASKFPSPGERVWVVSQMYDDTFTPVPGVWLGYRDVYYHEEGGFPYWLVYGVAVKGFSGSPVVNLDGEIVGIVSIGQFVDISEVETTELAPWIGVSTFVKGSEAETSPGLAPSDVPTLQ